MGEGGFELRFIGHVGLRRRKLPGNGARIPAYHGHARAVRGQRPCNSFADTSRTAVHERVLPERIAV